MLLTAHIPQPDPGLGRPYKLVGFEIMHRNTASISKKFSGHVWDFDVIFGVVPNWHQVVPNRHHLDHHPELDGNCTHPKNDTRIPSRIMILGR